LKESILLEGNSRRIAAWPRRTKQIVLVGYDFLALFGVVWLSYVLRLGQPFVPSALQVALMVLAPATAVVVFSRFGLYRAVIRFLPPERTVWTIIQAMTLVVLIWVALLFLGSMSGITGVPRSIPVLFWALGVIVVAGGRFAAKQLLGASGTPKLPVIIFGAGAEQVHLAAALRSHGERRPVAFVGDDAGLIGRDVSGLRVHPLVQLPDLIAEFDVRELIMTPGAGDLDSRQEVFRLLAGSSVRVRTLPAFADVTAAPGVVRQLRDIRIDDLLGRPQVPGDAALLEEIVKGRSIMVTGAGGSIGSELARLISKWGPVRLTLLEANEFALYEIDRKLRRDGGGPVVPVLGSVTDDRLVRRTIGLEAVEVVFHAAAHKHVPLLEANVVEAARNNVLGTEVVADAALELGASHFVLISTDKAVRPTSVMGATKRWAELIVDDRARRATGAQSFCAVRFGNVLGSSGSVVELFREQIARGGPVTLTHEEMSRYFMSIHEAAELIVQAAALSRGGDIMLLDMGEPIPIRMLAETMIRLTGLTQNSERDPTGDIAIQVTEPRRGEKLREELFYAPEEAAPTRHPKILRAHAEALTGRDLGEEIGALREAIAAQDEDAVRARLFGMVDVGVGEEAPGPQKRVGMQ